MNIKGLRSERSCASQKGAFCAKDLLSAALLLDRYIPRAKCSNVSCEPTKMSPTYHLYASGLHIALWLMDWLNVLCIPLPVTRLLIKKGQAKTLFYKDDLREKATLLYVVDHCENRREILDKH